MKWFCSHDDEVISNYREPSSYELWKRIGISEIKGAFPEQAKQVTVVQCKKCTRVKHIVTTL